MLKKTPPENAALALFHKLEGLLKRYRTVHDACLSLSLDERKLLAEMLLRGWMDESWNYRYFDEGSREERTARYAVANLLSQLPCDCDHPGSWVCHWLVDIFKPDRSFARDIVFRRRREGHPGTRIKHHQIGLDMLRMVRAGTSVKKARETVKAKYFTRDPDDREVTRDPDDREVKRIWTRYKPRLSGGDIRPPRQRKRRQPVGKTR
jgi:hypothetical protein